MSSSPSKLKALYEPEIAIEEGAIVAAKAIIQYMTASGSPASDATTPKVRLVVKFGTVFHPGSQLVVRLAPVDDEHDNDHADDQETVTCVVGKNNLFEETSRVVLDLGAHDERTTTNTTARKTRRRQYDVVGDFNRFAPRCDVRTGSVGSGNCFEASSYVDHTGHVRDGLVAAPRVRWSSADAVLDHRVLLTLPGRVASRPHLHGKERNVRALEALLPPMRVVVRRYHKLLENNNNDNAAATN